MNTNIITTPTRNTDIIMGAQISTNIIIQLTRNTSILISGE